MASRERDILEQAVRATSEQAANANRVIDEALAAGLPSDHPVTLQAKMLRLELLRVKADLERELRPGCSTARLAAWRSTGFRASAWPTQGIGDIGSPRRTASRAV